MRACRSPLLVIPLSGSYEEVQPPQAADPARSPCLCITPVARGRCCGPFGSDMKPFAMLAVIGVISLGFWFINEHIAPMFLDSKITRLDEKNLPKVVVEEGGIVYCRMKSDDFRFSLPRGAHALTPTLISGGFDWVDGMVEARFESSKQVTSAEYEAWLSRRLQTGAEVRVLPVPGGMLIKFHYFGDK